MQQGRAKAGPWSNRTAITREVKKIEKKKHINNA
jgi:glutathionyl-hydroquinone reductase